MSQLFSLSFRFTASLKLTAIFLVIKRIIAALWRLSRVIVEGLTGPSKNGCLVFSKATIISSSPKFCLR